MTPASQPALDIAGVPAAHPEQESEKWTERSILDLLHRRYSQTNPGNGPRYVCAEHVRSAAGFDARRTCDFMALDLWPSAGLVLHGHEVKVSRSDWLRELRDPSKAEEFTQHCDYWWIVAPRGVVKPGELPDRWGLIIAETARALRSAQQLRPLASGSDYWSQKVASPLARSFTAALMRAAAKTAARQAGAL